MIGINNEIQRTSWLIVKSNSVILVLVVPCIIYIASYHWTLTFYISVMDYGERSSYCTSIKALINLWVVSISTIALFFTS